MARTYPADPTFTAGNPLTAAQLNTLVSQLDFLSNPPRCMAYNANSSLSVVSATTTTINLNAESYDTDGMHDTVTNSSRITCTVAGLYEVQLGLTFTTNSGTGSVILNLALNGAIIASQAMTPDPATMSVALSKDVQMNVGDYVEMSTYQSSGANRGIAADTRTFLQARWVATS